MRQLNIDLDFNGVVANTLDGRRRFFEQELGMVIPRDYFSFSTDIARHAFSLRDDPEQKRKITSKEWNRVNYRFFTTDAFLTFTKPVGYLPGARNFGNAIEYIKQIRTEGHTIRIVSKIRSLMPNAIHEWLWQFETDDVDVIIVKPEESKVSHYGKSDVAVDDEVANLAPLAACNPRPISLVFMTLRNAGLIAGEELGHCRIAPNWYEVLKVVRQTAEA